MWPPKPATADGVSTDSGAARPATAAEVSTDFATPEQPVRPSRAPSASTCEPFREEIVVAPDKGRNAKAIWQDLVDDHGFRGRYASVKRFVAKLRGSSPVEAHAVITTAPGEEAQVDYGEGPMVREARSGKYRRTRLFVLTLGYSRKSERLLVWRSSTQTWAELHEQAFRRLGGTVRVLVLDNLKEGVLTPDVYDPALNPVYRDVLRHYGAVALPCRGTFTAQARAFAKRKANLQLIDAAELGGLGASALRAVRFQVQRAVATEAGPSARDTERSRKVEWEDPTSSVRLKTGEP